MKNSSVSIILPTKNSQSPIIPPQIDFTVRSAEELVVQVDSEKYLMNQILTLPFTEAQVIILKFYRDLKHYEIAELMDINKSSVKRYLKRGKEHLGKILGQQGGAFFL